LSLLGNHAHCWAVLKAVSRSVRECGRRRPDRGRDDLDAVGGEDVVEGPGELGVPVTNVDAKRPVGVSGGPDASQMKQI
jgi:hypothetical protein